MSSQNWKNKLKQSEYFISGKQCSRLKIRLYTEIKRFLEVCLSQKLTFEVQYFMVNKTELKEV